MTLGPEETNPGEMGPEKNAQRGSTKAFDARRLCAGLLAEVAATFETEQAVLYAAADRERLVFVVESAGEWAEAITFPRHEHRSYRDKRVDASAMQALRSASRFIAHGEYRSSGDFVAVPCVVDNEVVAVAALRVVPAELSATADVDETTLLALGLAVRDIRYSSLSKRAWRKQRRQGGSSTPTRWTCVPPTTRRKTGPTSSRARSTS